MYKGRLLALLGMAVLGVAVFAVTNYFPVSAESNLIALAPTLDCVAERYGDDGTTLTPYGPNACHKQKVFMNYGTYPYGGTRYETANCGAGDWCSWRVRCPTGSTVQTHGRYHYGFSPNISGLYDAPSHSFCVDASGNEVAPLLGESETYPFHAHSVSTTKVSLSKVVVVDTGEEYFYTYNPSVLGFSSGWVDCPGGSHGPYPQTGTTIDSVKDFPNHFHCANTSYAVGSGLNPEAIPVVENSPPSSSLVGYGFSTGSNTATNQFVDKTAFINAPIGSVMCVSTTSNKMYASTTGSCPSVSEFPLAPNYSFTWTQAMAPGATIDIRAGAEALFKANLANTGSVSSTYTFACNVTPYRPVSYRMLSADDTTLIPLNNGQLTVGTGVSRPSPVYCVIDMSGGTANTSYSVTFSAYPNSNPSDTKSLSATYMSGSYITTPTNGTCTALNLTIDAASYVKGTNVNYTYSCATPASGATISTAIVQVVKPDGTITTYVTGSNISTPTTSMGFGTDNLPAGAYTLRVCMSEACPAATTVSRTFTITSPTGTTPATTTNDSGLCLIRTSSASIPILNTPLSSVSNSGYNWEFIVKQGVNTIDGLKTACTTPEYEAMFNQFCSGWPGESIQYEVVTVNSEGKFQSSSCDDSGCDSHVCPTTATPPTAPPVGTACGTGMIWCPSTTTATAGTASGYCAATCGTTPTTPPVTPPGTQPTSCAAGSTCPSTSYCDNGQKCNYPDGRITCVAYPAPTAATMMTAVDPPVCPTGTSPCSSGDTMCRSRGMAEIENVEGMWCFNGQKYYRTVNGKEMMKCFGWSETPPTEYSNCRASDSSCVRTGGYGPESGTCNSMRCYQTAEDSDPNNNMYCAPPSTMPSSVMCPAGYSQCSREEKARGCRQVGDTWTAEEEAAVYANTSGNTYGNNFYCIGGQQCNLATGGGQCVDWNQSCPTGTRYCSAGDTNCVEPDSYKTITPRTDGTYSGYWCGGGGGMPFYSSTQIYCPPKRDVSSSTPMAMMWTAADVKATLDKLGAGWGLCNPSDPSNSGSNNGSYGKCREPGQTARGSDWCAWMPPMTGGGYSGYGNESRVCPKLTATVTPPKEEEKKEKEKPKLCLQVLTSAINPTTGECKTYNDSCIPEGWRPAPGGCSDQNQRQRKFCAENEIPTATNACEYKSYRMKIDTCKLEACEVNDMSTFKYIEVKGDANAKYTSCMPMAVGFEREWREARCTARPPREFGSEYWLKFDSTAPTVKYDSTTDKLVNCDTRENAMYAVAQPIEGEMFNMCDYVPKQDQAWYLAKKRSERKMFLLYREQNGNDVLPVPDPVKPSVISIPEISKDQCPSYIAGLRSGVAADKQFWKDLQRKASLMSSDYYGKDKVNSLLEEAKGLIVKIERSLRGESCNTSDIADILLSQNKLHSETFMQLNSYIPEIEDYAQYSYCSQGLASQADQLDKLLENANLSRFDGKIADEWMTKIRSAKKELDAAHKEGDFEAIYRCNNFGAEAYKAIAPLFRKYDVELNRIIDEVIGDRLSSVIKELEAQLAQREKKLDELLVQVAELHKKVEALSNEVTEAANRLTERLTVSYSALARIEDKFAEQKLQIETAKDRLTMAVERAIQTIETAKCVTSVNRDTLIEEFGTVASVNWIDKAEVDQIERRIDLFVASCTAKDVQDEDVYAFTDHIRVASETNLTLSYEEGLTPFPDVPTHTWYYGGMSECARRGCMTQGRPAEPALRQDALLMLLRESGASDADIEGSCTLPAGIQASNYAACAINYAIGKGLALSGDMKVPVVREEIAYWVDTLQVVPHAVAVDPNALSAYEDIGSVNPAYLNSIGFVVTNGAMVGQVGPTTSTFQPHANLTRAALSVVLEHVRD